MKLTAIAISLMVLYSAPRNPENDGISVRAKCIAGTRVVKGEFPVLLEVKNISDRSILICTKKSITGWMIRSTKGAKAALGSSSVNPSDNICESEFGEIVLLRSGETLRIVKKVIDKDIGKVTKGRLDLQFYSVDEHLNSNQRTAHNRTVEVELSSCVNLVE